MAEEDVAVQEFSTARGNTLTVLVDLVEGRARPIKQGEPVQQALRATASEVGSLRFQASSAA